LAQARQPQKEGEKVVREGETFEHKKVVLEIVEVLPYFDPSNRRSLMVAYRLKDGAFVSPVAHFWMAKSADVRRHVEEIVEHYLDILRPLRGIPT